MNRAKSVCCGSAIGGTDAHRRTRMGLGSHAATMRRIAHLHRNEFPYSVIAVLSHDSLDHSDEIVAFFVENGIEEVGFNIEETQGTKIHPSFERRGTEQRYQTFLQQLWELAAASEGIQRLREFKETCALAHGDSQRDRTDLNHPS